MTTFLLITAFIILAYLPAASLLGHLLRRIRMSYPTPAARAATSANRGYVRAAPPMPAGRMPGKAPNLSERLTPESGMCRPVPRNCAA